MTSPSHAVGAYLSDLHQSLGVGVPETSGYPALRNLLNAVGDTLKPKIGAVLHPSNSGAGLPDGGLFAARDLKKFTDDAPALETVKPERGVIEVKSLAQDIAGLEQTAQVQNYLKHYQQILITNYRSFALFAWKEGEPVAGERYVLADSEQAFWDKIYALRGDPKHPEHERLWQFLRRALLSTARISTPQDLAAFLASYAREARARVEVAPMGTVEPVRNALSEALGVHFEGERGAHFFQSTLIQTLFYGVFSAWVLWHESHPKSGDRFDWRLSAQHLGLPILRTLFVQLAGDPKKVRALNLEEVLDWTDACLARVDRPGFFARYDMGDAVQYFYEPFLAEFDPQLRKDFGVWYTPPEIVRYMVARVDAALRKNFNLPDGLADPSVVVLDPCCGTGAYLVETLRVIRRRLVDGYGEIQAGLKIREVAKKRLFGFELLPAPYVVSHLQIDLMLTRWGAALDHEQDERAGVFLTNALTGWVPVEAPKNLPFSEFGEERDKADHVKREEPILVILGNPPYDGYAGLAVEEERALSGAYRSTKVVPAPRGQGLNDLYIRFFRMAERRIAEGVPRSDDPLPGSPLDDARGIVCYISNYSWLDGLSHTGMRERFMEVFDAVSIDCLNGDKYKTGKKTPDGRPDPSVFSREKHREGIQVGTAISLLERWPRGARSIAQATSPTAGGAVYAPRAEVRFRHWWGQKKLAELSDEAEAEHSWQEVAPSVELGLPLVPLRTRADYPEWPSVTDLLAFSSFGVLTNRDEALVSIDLAPLEKRMAVYFDRSVGDQEVSRISPALMRDTGRFEAAKTRVHLVTKGLASGEFVRLNYRPFDVRWLYWHPETKLVEERRADLRPHLFKGNWLLAVVRHNRKGYTEPLVVSVFPSHHLIERGANYFPLFLQSTESLRRQHPDLFAPEHDDGPRPNVTEATQEYLSRIDCSPEELFFHIVAVLHAPAYRDDNAGALTQGWPRVPLPKDAAALRRGAELGRRLAELIDPETSVPGVTDLHVRPDLKGFGELVGAPTSVKRNPAPDLRVAARWGYAGRGGVVMPGSGRVTPGSSGDGFLDIHLNDSTRWKDVPERVWNYTLGGYQVLKKWLSYREEVLLGRPLTSDEVLAFTHNVRRIAAILSLHGQLNEHYAASITLAGVPRGDQPIRAARRRRRQKTDADVKERRP